MGRSKIQLGRPELAAEIALRCRRAKAGWEKSRLLCVKLAAEGQHHAAQIAGLCGCGVARVFDWLRLTREGGLQALLQRAKPGPKAGQWRLLADKLAVRRALQKGLAEGRWVSAPQLSRWLLSEHGLEIKKPNMYWSR